MEKVSQQLFLLFHKSPRHGEWVVACLEGAWPAIMGARIARVCRPVRLQSTILTVEVLNPEWEAPLREIGQDLLRRIQKTAGYVVQKIRFISKNESDPSESRQG